MQRILTCSAATAALLAGLVASGAALAQSDVQVSGRMTTSAAAPTAPGEAPGIRPEGGAVPVLTRDNGAPVGDNRNSKAAGDLGPVLLEDSYLIEKLARFDRERTPERVVHARGTGALGMFRATADISDLSRASLFQQGKESPVFVRFSSVIHGKDSPEWMRDPHGFATKFYTDQGNWDLVGNNLPVFFIRDAMQFPDMVHSLKPDPVTNRQDPNRFFDFFSATPESTNMLTHVYSNLGTPASYRTMDGNGVHAFKLVNAQGETVFAKFRWVSRQGVHNLAGSKAGAMPFDYLTHDLYSEIAKRNYPTWDLMVQVMRPADFAALDYNPFDDTKEWLGVPFKKIGEMTLNKVPDNFFEWTEQSAFAPSNMVPGIEPSPDRMLQGRLFSYADTQRYRIGANALALPVNKPRVTVVNNSQDGQLNASGRSSNVNYFPSALAPKTTPADAIASSYKIDATVAARPIAKSNNFAQAGVLYRSMSAADKADLIQNLSGDLGKVESLRTRTIMVSYFRQADAEYGARLAKAVNVPLAEVDKAVAEYRAAHPEQYAN
ncbi:catalase [Sphingomonas hengshuiensis]|uniref:Catalase n=1 Tax=Sphingomonas hengshuiensis TaxID=1609977 RepID=A0A7U5BEQ7_9SPHN|nr:catalase [Sphingomonas hengshuiensis]AJP70896.1 catalase [Sphingomonas hengshuiensis]